MIVISLCVSLLKRLNKRVRMAVLEMFTDDRGVIREKTGFHKNLKMTEADTTRDDGQQLLPLYTYRLTLKNKSVCSIAAAGRRC